MRCLLFACFSASKNKKDQHLVDGTSSIDQKPEANEAVQSSKEDFGIPFNPIIVKKEKLGELLNNSGQEKLSFDLYVKTHEELAVESSEKLLKNDEGKESEETVVFKPQNNRYQNSAESEDELNDLDLEINDLDDGNEDDGIEKAKNESQLVIEESSESLFSLSIESRKQVCEVESDEKEVNSPMPIVLNRNGKDKGGQYVQSVLNPVENLDQWKKVKAKASIPSNLQEKENINVEQGFGIPISAEPSFQLASSKLCSNGKKMVGKESTVDTSLSSWLVEPENTPNSKASTNSVGNSAISQKMNSPRSHENRPILGALTMEELKQRSASSSPRKCGSRSPDEAPIIGTVGSYWSHTGQNIDTDSSSPSKRTPRHIQEERLKLKAIPFGARLERALDTGIAGGV
ncbi:hypothetical protein ES332_A11G284800v1 [Gossypium tomentosum]|uniref:Uncharacterized protein n=1 Tax=Gossypium tomentosum TaxID=34277 RepID=A0A5D2NHT9_GOSTO|nr:hypothetical protein ES332_A11G284800v1 [Gossypium tomentosum]